MPTVNQPYNNELYRSYSNNRNLSNRSDPNLLGGKNIQTPYKSKTVNMGNIKTNKRNLSDLINQVRKTLISRSPNGNSIFRIGKQFVLIDKDKNKSIDRDEFIRSLNLFSTGLTEEEIGLVFDAFDFNKSNKIDYEEFLDAIRGSMNDFRKNIVINVFSNLDINGNNIIDIGDVYNVYSVEKNPDVMQGKKTKDQAYNEFLHNFETHHDTKTGMTGDNKVTLEEFIEYYNNISTSIDSDEYFEFVVKNSWDFKKLNELKKTSAPNNNNMTGNNTVSSGKSYSINGGGNELRDKEKQLINRNSKEYTPKNKFMNYDNTNISGTNYNIKNITNSNLIDPIVYKFTNILKARGIKTLSKIREIFFLWDSKSSQLIDANALLYLTRKLRFKGFDADDCLRLFELADKNRKGRIYYEELIDIIKGDCDDYRKGVIAEVFKFMISKTPNSVVVDLNDFKDEFEPAKHPDVLKGIKTEDEVIGEYLELFDLHFTYTLVNTYFNLGN